MTVLRSRSEPVLRSSFRGQLLAVLVVGGAIRALLIAVHPGEYYDMAALSLVGRLFAQSPLHLYAIEPRGLYQGLSTYAWPYPPAFLPVTALLHSLSAHTGVSVSRLDRTLVSVADLALAWLLQAGLGRLGRPPRERLAAAALVALGPAFFAVSGMHGQIDAVAWLPAIAGVLVWERRRVPAHVLAAGALIGLGIAIKTVPAVTLLGLAPMARSRRELALLLGSAAGVVLATLAPFAIVAPHALSPIADYRGFPGRAGLAVLLQPDLAAHLMAGTSGTFDATTRFLLGHAGVVLGPVVVAVWLLARRRGLGAADTVAALLLAVYVFAPAVLPQYWLWLVPFLILAGRYRAAAVYQLALLPLLALNYIFLAEPLDTLRLPKGVVLYGYVPLLWVISLGLLGALVGLLAPAGWTRPVAVWGGRWGWGARAWIGTAGRRMLSASLDRYALGVILLAGAGLRLWLMAADRPAFLGFPDSRAYLAAVNGPLFWNPYKPAGYPILLRILRALDPHLSATIVAQHLLGLLTALLLYLTTVRFVRHRWLALLPAAVVAFSGTQLYLEHAVLSDGPFALALAAALWCAATTIPRVRPAVTGAHPRVWVALAGAGALTAAATVLRPVGAALVGGLLLWAVARRWPSWRTRLRAVAACVAGCAALLVPYLIAAHAATGQWGLSRASSEQLYGRVATFADCRDFRPPAGTAQLCRRSPASERPHANWYLFDPASPLLRSFGTPGPGNPFDTDLAHYRYPAERLLSAFDRAALLHQPWAFVMTTLEGMVKYVAPHAGPASMLEWDTPTLIRQLHNPAIEADSDRYVVGAYHTPAGYVHHDLSATDAYAGSARVEGPLTALLLVLMLGGWILARGTARSAGLMLGACAVLMALAPVAALFYSARYATPAYGPLAAAAAIGVDALLLRLAAGRPG
ncbi:MAG: glycosyltransferase family 87 protein, partial [Solirubrobacteraceae bacterium]